jgi:predicted permease
MDLTAFYTIILALFVMLIIGFVGRKTKIINDSMSKAMSTIVIKIAQPFMIVGAMINVEYSAERLKNGFLVLVLGIIFHAVIAVIAYFSTLKYKNLDERKICEFAMIFGNCGFVGFPLLESLFGQDGLFYGSFFLVSFNIFVWTWGIMIFARQREDIKINPKTMILNYGTVPCVIGLLIFVTKLPIPDFVSSAVSYLGSLCTPLSVLIIGALLGTVSFKDMFNDAKIYVTSAMKLIVAPVVIAFFTLLIGFDEFIVFMAIVFAMPTASSTAIFAELYEVDKKKGAIVCGISSFLSMATMPLIMWCLQMILN